MADRHGKTARRAPAVWLGTIGAALCALAGLPEPARANTDLPADIAGPLRAARAANAGRAVPTGLPDEDFRRLMRDWRALENDTLPEVTADGSGPGASLYLSRSLARGSAMTAARIGAAPGRISTAGMTLTSGFGLRWHPILGGFRRHDGLDLAAPMGTPIRATADGVVGTADRAGGYGLLVALDHGSGVQTRYGHMSKIAVTPGQRVRKGDVIGYVGSTGLSTGPHLHYEVRRNGQAVDPMAAGKPPFPVK